MRFSQEGVSLSAGALWAGAWLVWLAAGAEAPLPPWKAESRLAAEEAAATRLAAPAPEPVWSIDVGGVWQALALGTGFSDHEAFVEGGRRVTFAWIEDDAGQVSFASPGWPQAHVSLRAYPLDGLAPLAVGLELDGAARCEISVPAGWTVTHAPIGPVSAGPHLLTLRPRARARPPREQRTLSLAVDGIAVGEIPVPDPHRDRGVLRGFLSVGLDDRPAVFASTDAAVLELLPGTLQRRVAPGLEAFYGFGITSAGSALTTLLAALQGLAAAALLVVLPGLLWTGLLGAHGLARLALAIGLSTLVLVVALLTLRVLGVPPSPLALAVALVILGSLPLPFRRGRGRLFIRWLTLAPAAAALVALTFFATAVVPPLEDQDMEVQATAYALATRQVPSALTNRGTTYFFAHPPLLHLWQAGSFALSGRLERVAYYDAAAREARRGGFVEPAPGTPHALRPHYREWTGLLRRFRAEPQLWPTRQVNVLLGAIAVGLLAALAASLAGSTAAGVGLALVFATFPETLVRGAYGGYFAATVALSLLVLATLEERAPSRCGIASGLAFLANQKALLVPAAWVLAAPVAARWRRLLPIAGALAGATTFAAWGLAIDSPSFLYEFVREHVLRRLTPSDVRFAADAARTYPSIPELWREFASRYGLLFTLWAAVAALKGVRSARPAARAAAASVLLGAVVFSLTDWRQTKHLALLAPPALLALAAAWPRPGPLRRAALIALALLVMRNLRTAWPLLASFEALRPSQGW